MIIDLNQENIQKLTKTEVEIIRFINDNEEQLHDLSIVDIAFETFSSPSTVSRAIRKCGISGFNELRYKTIINTRNKEIVNIGEIFNKSLIEAQNVLEQVSITSILESIAILINASRVFVLGRGLSEYVADEFAFKLQLLNINAVSIKDPNIMKQRAKTIHSNECIFIFSLNGKTQELIESAKYASINGCKIINCCCNDHSDINQYSNINLIGYKHAHQAITEYEVSSRVPLSIISRLIIDYMAIY